MVTAQINDVMSIMNQPVVIRSHTGLLLRNCEDNNARFHDTNVLDITTHMIIYPINFGTVIVKSLCNDQRNLQIQTNGHGVFANHNEYLWEHFEI